jgi:hypothetical protein
MEKEQKKIYFSPGDIVKYNKELPNAPELMQVVATIKSRNHIAYHSSAKDFKQPEIIVQLHGIRCMWFDKNGALNIALFDTKDLTLVKSAKNGK